jgi:hypothetical protein
VHECAELVLPSSTEKPGIKTQLRPTVGRSRKYGGQISRVAAPTEGGDAGMADQTGRSDGRHNRTLVAPVAIGSRHHHHL